MSKPRTIVVKGCYDCFYCGFGWKVAYCKNQLLLDGVKVIEKKKKIINEPDYFPEWCPLEEIK